MIIEIKKLNPYSEEEIIIVLGDIELTCFASICPFPVFEGKKYEVELEIQFFDVLDIQRLLQPEKSITRINYFKYNLKGWLENDFLDCGIVFRDEFFNTDPELSFYKNSYISVLADRIDIIFLAATN